MSERLGERRGNHDPNVSFLVPEAASTAPSERAGGAGKFLIAGEGGRVFNQRLVG